MLTQRPADLTQCDEWSVAILFISSRLLLGNYNSRTTFSTTTQSQAIPSFLYHFHLQFYTNFWEGALPIPRPFL